jgi:signal transduction histidine kinase/ActR/RegA family two-component response regulator
VVGAQKIEVQAETTAGPEQIYTRYQLTLMAMVFPVQVNWFFNVAAGVCLGLIGAPLLGFLWTLASCAVDTILQRLYRRMLASAPATDSAAGLRRLTAAVFIRSLLWLSAPTAFALVTHSLAGVLTTGVTALGLVATGVSAGWTSRGVFTAHTAPAGLAIAAMAFLLPPLQAAGILLGLASFAGTMSLIAMGTNKAIREWSEADAKTAAAMAEMKLALERSMAAERRVAIAVEIADLLVYEVDYVSRSIFTVGAESPFFGTPLTYEQMWRDPYYGVHADDRAAALAAWEAYEAGEAPYRVEYRLRCSDGREVWVNAYAEMTKDETGRPLTLVGALQDITERKRNELDLMHARDLAEGSNRAKSDFLATMGHEIRTPLNGVLGMVQAMERDELPVLQRKRLDVVRKSGEALLVLLNGLLDLAKIEAGKIELEQGEVEISASAASALDAFTSLAAERDVTLSLKVDPAAAGIYVGDPARVGQILYNLISNAVKFTAEGAVEVRVERPADALMIKVADTGIGIAATHRSTLFQKFVQGDASTTRRYGGSGLGLAITDELVRRMGGVITVESIESKGTTFTVALPLPRLRDEPMPSQAPAPAPRGEDTEPLPSLRILAAEDNPINQLVLKTLLNQLGVDPTMVSDGQMAVEACGHGRWDLILMDIQMPNMDGPTAVRLIRKAEAAAGHKRTPIIALTANVMTHQIAAYRECGIDDVVAKPIDAARLFEAIDQCITAPQEHPAAAPAGRASRA